MERAHAKTARNEIRWNHGQCSSDFYTICMVYDSIYPTTDVHQDELRFTRTHTYNSVDHYTSRTTSRFRHAFLPVRTVSVSLGKSPGKSLLGMSGTSTRAKSE